LVITKKLRKDKRSPLPRTMTISMQGHFNLFTVHMKRNTWKCPSPLVHYYFYSKGYIGYFSMKIKIKRLLYPSSKAICALSIKVKSSFHCSNPQ
jgi:hypothetical protein